MNRIIEAAPEAYPIPEARPVPVIEPALAPLPRHISRPTARFLKRAADLVLGLALVVPVLAVMFVIAGVLRLTSPGPILYGHRRIGQRGRSFRCWKFRTMVPDADRLLDEWLTLNDGARHEWQRDHKLRNDPRITRLGAFLRRTSLDELPQIWNVLAGDMSLVGPRPIVEDEVEKYGEDFACYASVRPGITGLWQVSGRNNTTYEQRVAFDVEYIRRWSPLLDLRILARTVRVVLFAEGAC